MRSLLFLAALAAALGCRLADDDTRHACERDEHCAPGRFCVQQRCQATRPPADAAPDTHEDDARDGASPDRALGLDRTPPSDCPADEFVGGSRCVSRVVSVAAASKHTCAVLRDGTVWCWGGTAELFAPAPIPVIQEARSIALGGDWGPGEIGHACVVTAAQRLVCWGSDGVGQLGGGEATGAVPRQVVGLDGKPLTDVLSVSLGRSFGCATTAAAVYCWGENSQGQLAVPVGSSEGQRQAPGVSPSSYYRPYAAAVAGVPAGSVAAGHDAAISSDRAGHVCGWGRSGGMPFWPSSTPLAIPACVSINEVHQVTIGWGGACVRNASGYVFCWGYGFGESDPPGSPYFMGSATQIAGGKEHVCALDTEGKVSCWGKGNQGELGNGPYPARYDYARRAEEVASLSSDVVAIGSGPSASHTCAIMRNGSLRCWGRNMEGQLGNELAGDFPLGPVSVVW